MFMSRIILAAALAFAVAPALAHEFWIEPLRYQVENGERLQADFRNGQEFAGSKLAFFDRNSARYDVLSQGNLTPLAPRSGDAPALDVAAPVADGLVVVVHETTPSVITYREWEKFLKFAAHKDFPTAAADHVAAGWSQDTFKESYTRHVKALIAVGTGAGRDQEVGMETEFTAITNPYDPSFTDEMTVRLTYLGAARSAAQVEVFERAADDSVTITLHRTDADGLAVIPVKPGHSYLFDAVVLRPFEGATDSESGPVWETLWAALTFAVPQ